MDYASVLAGALIALAATADPAPTANFVLVAGPDSNRLTYWDTHSNHKTDDGEIALAILDVGYSYRLSPTEAPKPELSGELRTHFFDCEWRTVRQAVQAKRLDAAGGEWPVNGPPSAGDRSFVTASSPEGRILGELCDGVPADLQGSKGEQSALKAVQKAGARLPPPSVVLAIPPPPARSESQAEPGRYGVAIRGTRGTIALIDWSSLVRKDETAEVRSLWVLPAGKGMIATTAMLRDLSFDCTARTMAVRGETFLNARSGARGVSQSGRPARPIEGPAEKTLLKEACSGVEPGVIYEALDIAIAAIQHKRSS